LCNNTVGGYECVCLPGAYLLSGTEQPACKACGCEEDGVTEDFCNRETGVCHCRNNVVGHDCESCAEGYTNYPYCNKCNAGYHGFPDCQQCACSLQGTTSEMRKLEDVAVTNRTTARTVAVAVLVLNVKKISHLFLSALPLSKMVSCQNGMIGVDG